MEAPLGDEIVLFAHIAASGDKTPMPHKVIRDGVEVSEPIKKELSGRWSDSSFPFYDIPNVSWTIISTVMITPVVTRIFQVFFKNHRNASAVPPKTSTKKVKVPSTSING